MYTAVFYKYEMLCYQEPHRLHSMLNAVSSRCFKSESESVGTLNWIGLVWGLGMCFPCPLSLVLTF